MKACHLRSILAEVGDRGRLARSSIAYSQATDCIRQLVAQLGGEVKHKLKDMNIEMDKVGKLREGLASSAPRLTGHELNRRRDLLDSLQRKERSLRDVVSP